MVTGPETWARDQWMARDMVHSPEIEPVPRTELGHGPAREHDLQQAAMLRAIAHATEAGVSTMTESIETLVTAVQAQGLDTLTIAAAGEMLVAEMQIYTN